MEETKKGQASTENQTVECTNCHKPVQSVAGQQTSKGFVCNECIKSRKKRKHLIVGSTIGIIGVSAAIAGSLYMSSTNNRTAEGFGGVGQIKDSMTVVVDSANVAFDMATATATSAPVSTQAPISNIDEFKRVMDGNISDAREGKSTKITIPAIGILFKINTDNIVHSNENIIKEFVMAYLRTNKQANILVEGYTCDLGGDQLNLELSRVRAETIKKKLVDNGVSANKIETKWYGKTRFADYSYPEKSDYRRVVVSIK